MHMNTNSTKTQEELALDHIKSLLTLEKIREKCPTCIKAEDGTFDKQGIQCVLHNNPDVEKYYCKCADSPTMAEMVSEVFKLYDL